MIAFDLAGDFAVAVSAFFAINLMRGLGAVGALLGIPAAMVVAGLVMLPSLLLYGRALRREVAEAAEAAAGALAAEG